MFKHLAMVFSLLICVAAEFILLEKRDNPPAGFSRLGPTADDDILSLTLALPSRNIAGLHDAVYNISTPGTVRYGQYLTQDEVGLCFVEIIDRVTHQVPQLAQFVAPAPATVSQVASWLSSNNLAATSITPAGEWITVNMTVSQANALFAADFRTFQNDETNQTVVRTLSYSIPSALKASIDWVHPTIRFISGRFLLCTNL
jgi:tripeptidyl-peptidase-1